MKKEPINAAEHFFIKEPTPQPEARQKEYKSVRLQLLIRPTTKSDLKRIADDRGQSLNDLINQVLEEYTERNSK